LIIDPQNPKTVFASSYRQLWVTRNGGADWSIASRALPADCCASLAMDPQNSSPGLAIDPQNPDTVYIATASRGVFKSTDGTGSWNAVNSGVSATLVYASALDPQNPGTLYAASGTG